MEEQEEILDLILGRKEEKDGKRKSTLQIALSVARYLSSYLPGQVYNTSGFIGGRVEWDNGSPDSQSRPTFEESDLFAALLLYLVSLEQVGELFIKDTPKKDNNGIVKTLRDYTSLSNDEIQAIKGLRNALGHNFGLVAEADNRSRNEFGAKDYKYTLVYNSDKNDIVIELPKEDFGNKGRPIDWSDKSEETYTKIYPINLINLIEKEIIEKIQSDSDIKLTKNIEEIKSRFTIITE